MVKSFGKQQMAWTTLQYLLTLTSAEGYRKRHDTAQGLLSRERYRSCVIGYLYVSLSQSKEKGAYGVGYIGRHKWH